MAPFIDWRLFLSTDFHFDNKEQLNGRLILQVPAHLSKMLLNTLVNLESPYSNNFFCLDFRPHISGGGSFDLDVSGLTVTLSMKLGEFS